jgi:acyl carrier protein
MPMTLPEFFSEVEGLASRPRGSIGGQELLESMEGWDSLALVEFMALADEKFGIQLEPAQLAACTRVNDLAALCGFKL